MTTRYGSYTACAYVLVVIGVNVGMPGCGGAGSPEAPSAGKGTGLESSKALIADGANIVTNPSFTDGIAGWVGYQFDENGGPPRNQLVSLTHLPAEGRDGGGAMRVTVAAPADASLRQLAYLTGASPVLSQRIPANVAVQVSLWVRGSGASPQLFQLSRLWGGEGGDLVHTIDSQWRRVTFNFYSPYDTDQLLLNLRSPVHMQMATTGQFDIDDVEVTPLRQCNTVFPVTATGEVNCAVDISNATNFEDHYWVSFDAKAAANTVLRVGGQDNSYLGEPEVDVSTAWQHQRVRVVLHRGLASLSFRAIAGKRAPETSDSVPSSFDLTNFSFERATDCEQPADQTNLVANGSFACDRYGWIPYALDQVPPIRWAPEYVSLRHQIEPTRPAGEQGVLITRILPTPADRGFYSHTHGAGLTMRQPVPKGAWFRVAFDSKRTDPQGSKYLRFNRLWGGMTGLNTVVLKDSWQHYELLGHEDYGSGTYLFVLHDTANKDAVIDVPAPGEFALDDVRLESLPTCGPDFAVERESIAHCMPASIPVGGNRLKVTFTAQLTASGSQHLRVTGPWGANVGDAQVELTGSAKTYTVNVQPTRDEFGPKPLAFRLWDETFGPWSEEVAAGKFSISDVTTEEVVGCDNNAGFESLGVNGSFNCDAAGWAPVRWDGNTSSWNSASVGIARVASGTDHPTALQVTVNKPTANIATGPAPAGAAMLLREKQPAPEWLRVSFDARRADPQGGKFLKVSHFWQVGGESFLEIDDTWQHYTVSVRMHQPDDKIYFSLTKTLLSQTAVEGAFELDNVVVEHVPRCDSALAGDYRNELVCELPEALKGKPEIAVTFQAQALSGGIDLAVTGAKGQYFGDTRVSLTSTSQSFFKTIRTYVPDGIVSIRLIDPVESYWAYPLGQGNFRISQPAFSEGAPCATQDSANNLAGNGNLECDIARWHGVVYDIEKSNAANEFHWRSDLIHLAHETVDTPAGSQGALRVTIDDAASQLPAYDFLAGATFPLKATFPPGSHLRVAFDAKSISGSKNIKIARFWGGDPGPNTFVMSSQWQHFVGALTDIYGGSYYQFLLSPSSTPGASNAVAGGTFLVDNVVFEVVPSCTSNPASCDDGNPCTWDACGSSGACQHTPKPANTECSDGDLCNGTEMCSGTGACLAGTAPPPSCNDGDSCTTDTCSALVGCVAAVVPPQQCEAITPKLLGIAEATGGVLKAVFDYDTAAERTQIPYGFDNTLLNQSGRITNPTDFPPAVFVKGAHAPFVASLNGAATLTWSVKGRTATATPQSTRLPQQTQSDGTQAVLLPDGRRVNLDLGPPKDPAILSEPTVGLPFKGTLKGSLSVSPTGAAIYTVPIALPPGINGMAPNLNLVYSSQAGVGMAGQGWDLTGLSTIHRCAKTKVQDGEAKPIEAGATVDESDGICLDGKRLFASKDATGLNFRAEVQDFSSITFASGQDHFKMAAKSGETRTYGRTTNSRLLSNIGLVSSAGNSTPILAWALDRVSDAWGNHFDITYQNDDGDGIGPSKIDVFAAGSNTPLYSVTFSYNPSLDDYRTIRIGDDTFKKKQITGISSPLGTYGLTYLPLPADKMMPNRLDTISFCTGFTCTENMKFDWEGGGYRWEEAPRYALPARIDGHFDDKGKFITPQSMFVDLTGDGRPDFVTVNEIWENTINGWELLINTGSPQRPVLFLPQSLPDSLANIDRFFVDMDGDGLPDFVSGTGGALKVWRNQIKRANLWEHVQGFGQLPPIWGQVKFGAEGGKQDKLADVNGDGLSDLVRLHGGKVRVLLNTGSGWTESSVSYNDGNGTVTTDGTISLALGEIVGFRELTIEDCDLVDVNGDGLADILPPFYGERSYEAQNAPERFALINGGSLGSFGGVIWSRQPVPFDTPPNDPELSGVEDYGDLDGDGQVDRVRYHTLNGLFESLFADLGSEIRFKSGNKWMYQENAFRDALGTFGPNPTGGARTEKYFNLRAPKLADLNADGLADLVINHADGGQLLVNTGTTWKDINGNLSVQGSAGANKVPVVTSALREFIKVGSAFVDIDGDGVTDLVQATKSSGTLVSHAWLNKFKPPIITGFPAGLAKPTRATYAVITSAEAQKKGTYFDSAFFGSLASNASYLMAPIRVVSKTEEEDGAGDGEMLTTEYSYADLRMGRDGRGSLGFGTMKSKQTSPTRTHGIEIVTHFVQGFPYTGMVASVAKSMIGTSSRVVLSWTTTNYCDQPSTLDVSGSISVPACSAIGGIFSPQTSFFVYPRQTIDFVDSRSIDGTSSQRDDSEVTTKFAFDQFGNSIQTSVVSTKVTDGSNGLVTDTASQTTTNIFGTPGSSEEAQGKVTMTTITSTNGEGSITRTTGFEYKSAQTFGGESANLLVLTKQMVEPTSGWPIELHTAYAYDRFGNAVTTTSCANDFSACQAGALGPVGSSDPVHHEPFRTTRVSFDPADFNAPVGAGLVSRLDYGTGRFPVRTTNAMGHSEYSAYDPFRGDLIQKTGPNGVHMCFTYDPLGRLTSTTERCGSDVPLVTSNQYYLPIVSPSLTSTRSITVTRLPTGTWSAAHQDHNGRTVETRTPGFDGTPVVTRTFYNEIGQVSVASKPFKQGQRAYYAGTGYDELDRPSDTFDYLGPISDLKKEGFAHTTISYQGSTVTTTQTVNGHDQSRSETKNALGKVASVTDPNGATINYFYYADGNLKQTTDPLLNSVKMFYDLRGRKTKSIDPDLGEWSYVHNGFGDLISQTDARGNTTTMVYDALGRMMSKTDDSGTAQWVYDVASGAGIGKLAAMISAPDDRFQGSCTVPFITVSGGKRAGRSYSYDEFGQLHQVSECADGSTFVSTYEKDRYGRQSLIRYPAVNGTQLAVRYHYNKTGFLHYITDESADYSVLWQVDEMNALGQVVREKMRNGVQSQLNRNPSTGWLRGATSVALNDGNTKIQDSGYEYDEAGNLKSRAWLDAASSLQSGETFTYDLLNRLRGSTVTPPSGTSVVQSYEYDVLGNLTAKAGKMYQYKTGCLAHDRPAGPHAVCAVGGATYQYDANGNMIVGGGRSVSYNLMNKVEHLVSTNASQVAIVDFMYGADGNRVVQMISSNGGDSRTVYVGLGATGKSLYERTTTPAGVEHVNFIYAGDTHSGNAFSIRVLAADGSAKSSKYFSLDHLGSTTLVSDELGRVSGFGDGGNATALGYDAWGARRNTDGTVADPAMLKSAAGRREYTGHEAIADVGLVNMNGRVYDPGIGRFLSADPNVQFVADLQSYNRYSYVQNNPLRYTDPTGYLSWGSDTWVNIAIGVVGVGVCTYTGGSACPLYFAAVGAAFNGYRAYERGADGQQIVTSVAVGMALGGIGGAVGGAASNNPAMQNIIGGAVSGALSGAYGTALSGGGWGDLGTNMLTGVAVGAATAAAFYELRLAAVSIKQVWAAQEGNTLRSNGDRRIGTARLWSRNIDRSNLPWYGRLLAWATGASHAGWAIETPAGTYIIESGCDGCDHLGRGGTGEAYVKQFENVPEARQHFETDNHMTISEHGRWTINIENFDSRAHIIAEQFNTMRIPYDWGSTNSNYFGHWFGNQVGIPTNQTMAGSPFQPGHWLAFGWSHPDVSGAARR